LGLELKALRHATAGRSSRAAHALQRSAHIWLVGPLFVAAYVFLDWISFIEPYGDSNITPWNPGTGLSFALILIFGRRMIPFFFVARFLGEFISGQAITPLAITIASTVLSSGYVVALLFLLASTTQFDPGLTSMRDLIALGLAATLSATFMAWTSVTTLVIAGLLASDDFAAATLRYWVGEMIGIIVITPFGLVALARRRHTPFLTAEFLLQCVAIGAALIVVFGYSQERQFQLFYILFLPIVWIAVRSGFEAVTIGMLLTQIGLIIGLVLRPGGGQDVTAFQALMLVLGTTGLIAGQLVAENRGSALKLHAQQQSLARIARLGSIGELAMAIAHELNQPLMAAGTYTRLLKEQVGTQPADNAAVVTTVEKTLAQVERATEVVKRLRALVRLDRSQRKAATVEHIVNETLALCQPDLDRAHASVEVHLDDGLPPVMADILQVEQVLLNLLHNAAEAITEAKQPHGVVTITALAGDDDFVEVGVTDTGPGFPPHLSDDEIHPFLTTKTEGLGFGLPLCKSIIEAHGGRLWIDRVARGASIRFTLPVVKDSEHA